MRGPVDVGDSKAVADLIRSARSHAGLTQAALAARIRTKQSVVSRWERGRGEPRLSTLVRIMRACGLSIAVTLEPVDVHRAQIRQQLAMSPAERLAGVANLSRVLATARRVG